ncbi:MAG: M20/M25/M40 family metallo-hydrolase [Candidatus Hodarchaeota archaeon]
MLDITKMRNFVDEHTDNAIQDLFKLLKIPTVSAKGREHTPAILAELNRIFADLGFETNVFRTKGDSVFTAVLDNQKPKTLLFYNHFDVQPAEPLEKWFSPPFEPQIRDGKIYARGVADNKGDIITRVYAIKMLQDLQGELPVNIKFLIEGEEETGSQNLPEFEEKQPDFIKTADACIWECGGKNASQRQEIWAGMKGILYVQLKTSGSKKDLHSALNAIIENPAEHLVSVLASLKDDKTDRILIPGFYEDVLPPSEELLRTIDGIEMDLEKQKAQWGVKELKGGTDRTKVLRNYYLNPTCNICGIWSGWQGSGAKTVLPAEAHAKMDFRLVPKQNSEDILQKLRRYLANQKYEIEIEWAEGYSPGHTPLSDPFVSLLKTCMTEVYAHEPIVHPWNPGSGPIYLFTNQLPVLSIGVGNAGSSAHGPNENIEIGDFKLGQICIARVIERMGKD